MQDEKKQTNTSGVHLFCDQRIPDRVQQKAQEQLLRFRQGERITRKVKCGGKKNGVYALLKIDVGAFWRLVSKDRGKNWELMSHERYNKVISQ